MQTGYHDWLMKPHALRIVSASLALAGLWLAWSQNPPAALTLQKVSNNLYVIIGDGGNSAFMPTGEGVILVDDKFAADGPQILAKIKSVTDKPVKYVINTHQHPDHTGGNEAFLAANAEIVIQKNARANMVAGKMPGVPRITFNDEAQVFLGGIRRLEAKGARDLGTRGRHAAFCNGGLNELQDLGLTRGKIRHAAPVYVDTLLLYTV